MTQDIVHCASARVAVPADFAFARLRSPDFVGGWALGSMDLRPSGAAGVFEGRSLFDGSAAHVEILACPERLLIDYAVGTLEARSPRISMRITPGAHTGGAEETCTVVLIALRAEGAPAERWARTCAAHETEILLVKGQLETAWAARGRA